jgi:tellurite resistance protein TerC
VVGSTLLLLGILMIVAPGPGILTLFMGLAVLGAEFAWARRWLARTREKAQEMREDFERVFTRKS